MTDRLDELVTQAIVAADTDRVEDNLERVTGELRRHLNTAHYQTVQRHIQAALYAMHKKDDVINALRDELDAYRHRYHMAVGVVVFTTVCWAVALAGRPVWTVLRHWMGG